MAQTRKKRRTKHRGNAAGMVEARGRTGRAPGPAKGGSTGKPADRRDRPPTWRSAITRSMVAVFVFIAVLVLLLKQPAQSAVLIGLAMLVFYVPMSYATDRWVYKRRMAKKAQGR